MRESRRSTEGSTIKKSIVTNCLSPLLDLNPGLCKMLQPTKKLYKHTNLGKLEAF